MAVSKDSVNTCKFEDFVYDELLQTENKFIALISILCRNILTQTIQNYNINTCTDMFKM